MFDANVFKRAVKAWMKSNPQASLEDLADFCEEQIPPAQFASNQWLIEQTVSWYGHILAHRNAARLGGDEAGDESVA